MFMSTSATILDRFSKGNKHTLGRVLTPEHKAAISAGGKGRIVSEETKTKLRGRIPSEETRAKISAANKGRVMPPEWRANISASLQNRPPMSAETRAKLSLAGKGKRTGKDNPAYGIPKTDAQKKILREAMLGRRFSAETLAKRSGRNHPKSSSQEYTLRHDTHGEVTADRQHFMDTYGFDSSKFSALLRGKRKSWHGWSIVVKRG